METLRPSWLRVLGTSATLAVMGVGCLLLDPPPSIGAMAIAGLCLAAAYVWISSVTRIAISAQDVRVRVPFRGVTVFSAGDTKLGWQQTAYSPFNTAPLLTLSRLSDNRGVNVPLVAFSARDRRRVRQLLERALRPR